MKVWITKYALTEGIREREAVLCLETRRDGRMISVPSEPFTFYHKPDWYATREDAVERAEKMRVAKIVSLKKQIAKLEGMSFGSEVE